MANRLLPAALFLSVVGLCTLGFLLMESQRLNVDATSTAASVQLARSLEKCDTLHAGLAELETKLLAAMPKVNSTVEATDKRYEESIVQQRSLNGQQQELLRELRSQVSVLQSENKKVNSTVEATDKRYEESIVQQRSLIGQQQELLRELRSQVSVLQSENQHLRQNRMELVGGAVSARASTDAALAQHVASSGDPDSDHDYCQRTFGIDVPLCDVSLLQSLNVTFFSDPTLPASSSLINLDLQGRWLNAYSRTRNPILSFVPKQCCYRVATFQDHRACLRRKAIAFVGDSTARRMWRCAQSWVTNGERHRECDHYQGMWQDHTFQSNDGDDAIGHMDYYYLPRIKDDNITGAPISGRGYGVKRLIQLFEKLPYKYDMVLVSLGWHYVRPAVFDPPQGPPKYEDGLGEFRKDAPTHVPELASMLTRGLVKRLVWQTMTVGNGDRRISKQPWVNKTAVLSTIRSVESWLHPLLHENGLEVFDITHASSLWEQQERDTLFFDDLHLRSQPSHALLQWVLASLCTNTSTA